MHGIGKVDRSGINRQLDNTSFGGKHIEFVRVQLGFDVFNKFMGGARTLLQLQQALHPAPGPDLCGGAAVLTAGFVHPVGCYALIGHFIHLGGADLDFDRNAVRAN